MMMKTSIIFPASTPLPSFPLQLIGTYAPYLFATPLDPFSTVAIFVIVLSITSIKEGVEDFARSESDKYENTKDVIVCTFSEDGILTETVIESKDVAPGDIIRLNGPISGVPCDLLLILTSYHDDGNKCYIETANLDGETNLKLKEVLPYTLYIHIYPHILSYILLYPHIPSYTLIYPAIPSYPLLYPPIPLSPPISSYRGRVVCTTSLQTLC